MTVDKRQLYKANGFGYDVGKMDSNTKPEAHYNLKYDKNADVLAVAFKKPQEIIYDIEGLIDEKVIMGRDLDTGKISALGILGFKKSSNERVVKLKQLLSRYHVELPQDDELCSGDSC